MKKDRIWKAFKTALPYTIPVLAGYLFTGLAYGIYMHTCGFSFLYPLLMSIVIYGGSLEFVAVTMLMAPFAPAATFIMALMIQVRHLFYGVSMLEKYKGKGWKKPYLIFGLSDETFSVNYAAQLPEDIDEGWFYFFVTLLDQFYWVTGAGIGGILGNVLPFNTEGLSFVMTALFVTIFLNQWDQEQQHLTALLGLLFTLVCLLLFGSSQFILPSMLLILAGVTVFRKPIEKKGGWL